VSGPREQSYSKFPKGSQDAILLHLHFSFYQYAHVTTLFTDAPSEPRDLEIFKFDKTSVTLKWKAPTDDGGNPLQGICLPLIEAFLAA